jgi:hypothetical protein
MEDSVADQMNSGLFLAPDLVGEYETDPLLAQAMQNVDDTVDEIEAREAAKTLTAAHKERKTSYVRPVHEIHMPDSEAKELREIVATLVPLLGRRYTAVIGGVDETGAIAGWVRGVGAPSDERLARLRLAYHVAKALTSLDEAKARHWFLEPNGRLNNQRPIALVASQPAETVKDQLLSAAKAAN